MQHIPTPPPPQGWLPVVPGAGCPRCGRDFWEFGVVVLARAGVEERVCEQCGRVQELRDLVARGPVAAADEDRIREALQQTAGNQTKAAKLLGMSRRTLVSRLDKYGIDRPRKK